MAFWKRVRDNSIKADDLNEFYDEIRMRDETEQPLGYINFGKFRIEFRRASLRRDYLEADVRIYVGK